MSTASKFYDETYELGDQRQKSPVDFFNPDLKLFPKFSAAKSWDFNLSPGDCIYVPSFYQMQIKGHKVLD